MGDIVNAVADVFGFGPASKQADATTQAANISAQAQREALALQQRMFERQVQLQEPWRQSGIAAQNRLLTLLGLSPNVAAVGGGGGGGFGIAGAIANQIASSGALGTPSGLTVDASSPDFNKYGKAFSEINWQQDPGYAFRLSEGQKALERSTAARAGLQSGAALKAAARYGQQAASDEYQNAFNRYYNERNQMLNPLQSLAGVGQTSANTLGSAGQNYAGAANQLAMTNAANQGNLALQAGNIRASQYGNYGNALNTALNTNWSKYFGGGGSSGGGVPLPGGGTYSDAYDFSKESWY